MHLLIKARSGGLILKNDSDGKFAMVLDEDENGKFLPLCGQSIRRGMLSYILGERRRIHSAHNEPPLFEDPMREKMLARMQVRITRDVFCHTVFGQYANRVLPSKIRIDDYGWRFANKLIAFLRPALTKVTGMESLGDVNAALFDALAVSGAKQRKFFVALKRKNEGKPLRDVDVLALRYKDELEMAVPATSFDKGSKIEKKLLEYLESAVTFVGNGFSGRKIPISEMHLQLLAEIDRLCKDAAWRRGLQNAGSTKFSIIPYPMHTAQWVDIPVENILYVRGAPLTFATCDFDLLVPDLTEAEIERIKAGPMSCFYAKWGTGFVTIEDRVNLDEFDDYYPVLSEDSLKAAGVEFPRVKAEEPEDTAPSEEALEESPVSATER